MAKRFIGNVKGVGISKMIMEFYLSSSGSVMDGGTWSAEAPTLGNNKYLWTRWKITLTDSSILYTTPVCDGVWESIYGIYDVEEQVVAFIDDVVDLKTRMTAEEAKVQPVAKGGTGAITAKAARENLGLELSAETKQMFADAGYPLE